MKDIIENVKQLFKQLFGFEEIEENKEWNEYLTILGQNGYFSSQEIEDFKESEIYTEKLEKRLEESESSKLKKNKTMKVKNLDIKNATIEVPRQVDSKDPERE